MGQTSSTPQIQQVTEEHVSEAIYVYRNAFSDELCDEIWDFYYSNINFAAPGETLGGFSSGTKNTIDFHNHHSFNVYPELRNKYDTINEKIYQSLRVITSMYIDRYDWIQGCPNLVDTNYLWQGYKRGDGYYKEHIDGENWSPRVRDRVMAIVAYVNTVEEGGETYFRYQNVSVKPVKGSVCIFPTNWQYPHQAQVPLSSDKLIISSFVVTPQN
jgi:hypothetical protein